MGKVDSERTARRALRRKYSHVWLPTQKHRMTTRLARKVSVYNATLQTPELLENILMYLEPEDLLGVRQVCKSWNELINTSPVLRRCLYTLPEDVKMTWVLDQDTQALQPYRFDRDADIDKVWFSRQGACVPAVLNTTFLSRDPACASGRIGIRQRFNSAESLKFHGEIKSFNAAISVEHAYLTQPPAKEVVVYLAHRDRQPRRAWTPKDNEQTRLAVKVDGGVKWLHLLKAMRNALKSKTRKSPRLWIDIELSKVWVIGSVFYNPAEYQAVMSGQEGKGVSSGKHRAAKINTSPFMPYHSFTF